IAPETDYAIGKFAAERVIRKACRQTDTPLFILRLPGIYGPGDTSPRIIARAIRALKSDGRLTVNGDGSQQRDWVFVTDIARLIVRLTEAEPRSGLANIGTGTSHSVNHMLSLLEAAAGRPLKVDYREAPGGPPLIALDTRERQRLFPGLELTELKAGLTQTYDVF
ncbi:MAG: NAD-dependent epimerase/dehydratase family protein, partial [Verrucomicrobiota bacterium]